jgi:Trk K+ transport system NAD-binding subunit
LLSQKVGRTPVVMLGVLEHSNIEAVEIILDENSPLVGAQLSEIQFPREALIISVIRDGEAMLPSGETVFASGDVLIALIPREWESTLREFIV